MRLAREPVERMHAGSLMVDLAACEAFVSGERLHLTPLEFKLLAHLMQRAGRVQTRERLLRDVWENSSVGTDRTVDTHVRRLRTKLGPAKECIRTARGAGYCFKSP